VHVFDLIEDNDNYYIITEVIRGGPVSKRLKKNGPFNEQKTVNIVSQIVMALSYLHGMGICHRDLKLENIMFTSDKSLDIKLIDFGFSSFFKGKNQMYIILGSPLYMSPELVNQSNYDQGVDIWALGVMTYLLLSGKYLFAAPSCDEIHQNTLEKKISFDEPEFENITGLAKDFMMLCLERDPEKRSDINELMSH